MQLPTLRCGDGGLLSPWRDVDLFDDWIQR